MGREENREVAKRCLDEIANNHRLELADEVFTTEILFRTPQIVVQGRKAVVAALSERFSGLPDLCMSVDYIVADDHAAACRVSIRGTMSKAFLNQPPTFRKTTLQAILLVRFADARIAEIEVFYDRRQLQEQLGTSLPQTQGAR
jgi:predicted ester cyclase